MTDAVKDAGSPNYGTVDRAYGMRLATTAPNDDGPVWMVNLMSYHEVAQYADGRDEAISGREADNRYSPIDVLTKIGAEPVFVADVDTQLLGDSPKWDRVAIAKYPTRRSFVEMQSRSDFQEKHVHKAAGMAETIVMGCLPIGAPSDGADHSNVVDWNKVPHPPTAEAAKLSSGVSPCPIRHVFSTVSSTHCSRPRVR